MEEVLIQTDNVSVRILELKTGEALPWHYHSEVTDYIFALDDEIEIELRSPNENVHLKSGQKYTIPTGRVHRVVNPRKTNNNYLLIQGVGRYDFKRSGD